MNNFHNVLACYDGVFNTSSGKLIDIANPNQEIIDIEDIASALSKICRFGGHSSQFYSVAQHSVIVMEMMPANYKKEGLLHDAAEAYLGDVIKPLKVLIGEPYKTLEDKWEEQIAIKFNLSPKAKETVKRADNAALIIEHSYLIMGNYQEWQKELSKMFIKDHSIWPPEKARDAFLFAYNCFK